MFLAHIPEHHDILALWATQGRGSESKDGSIRQAQGIGLKVHAAHVQT